MAIAVDGYMLLRGVVARDVVGDLRERIDQAVAAAGDGVQVRAGTVWIKEARVLGPGVAALCADPDVVSAVAELLGPAPMLVTAVMRNPIGTTAQQALHVDWAGPIEPGGDQQAQAMFFLDDVDSGNGPTRLVPGSHRWRGVPPKALTGNSRGGHPDEVSMTGRTGDVLVFSSHLWHSGTGNGSGRPRRVITATYRRA